MRPSIVFCHRTALALVIGSFAACSDGATVTESDINPGLLEASNAAGFASSADLPQGSAPFTGPGGMTMDATAEEFIQQLTLEDGTVLRTSGIHIRAVPDEALTAPVIDRLSFGPVNTGSLESMPPGTYTIGEWPPFDFIEPVQFAHARVRATTSQEWGRATSGVVTIQSLNYFNDVYDCQLSLTSVVVDRCEYQLGMVNGVIEFDVPAAGSVPTMSQQRTQFTVPIMRRLIIVHIP
jgi:hypothetical protein